MKTAAATALVLFGLVAAALPAHAEANPTITLLSPDPLAGDYTMVLRVDGFTLSGNFSQKGDSVGHLYYSLNGAPCTTTCSPVPWQNANTTFTFHDVKAGDIIGVTLVHGNGTDLAPPVYLVRTVKNLSQAAPGPRLAINGTAPHSATPNPGDYTMVLDPVNIQLVAPTGQPNDRTSGHLRYLHNGQACVDDCAGGASPITTATTFTFHGIKVGDVVGVELLYNDGTPYYPAVRAVQYVAVPTVQILTAQPHGGDTYGMTVRVTAFTLFPTGSGDANAGAGHLRYIVKHKDAQDFQTVSGGETEATSHTFKDLAEGDVIGVELATVGGQPLSPNVRATQTVLAAPEPDPLAPGVGPILLVVLLGAALIARRRA